MNVPCGYLVRDDTAVLKLKEITGRFPGHPGKNEFSDLSESRLGVKMTPFKKVKAFKGLRLKHEHELVERKAHEFCNYHERRDYCSDDVTILRKGCLAFKEQLQSMDKFGDIDPFAFTTLASYGMSAYMYQIHA